MKELKKLEEKIGIVFRDQSLLKQALTHSSYVNENRSWTFGNNERLEFLGDAVIEVTARERLFTMYPEKDEGELTSLKGVLVSTKSFSNIAKELGLDDFILMSKGEREKGEERARTLILGSAYEALAGAIYLDQGFVASHDFVRRTIMPRLIEILGEASHKDAKSFLQEQSQAVVGITPCYKILQQTGKDHDKTYTVGVYLGEEMVATGQGRSKKDAEMAAAESALTIKGWSEET